jgi:hypothetical protein
VRPGVGVRLGVDGGVCLGVGVCSGVTLGVAVAAGVAVDDGLGVGVAARAGVGVAPSSPPEADLTVRSVQQFFPTPSESVRVTQAWWMPVAK